MELPVNLDRYSAQESSWQDEPVIMLRDNTGGSVALIAPTLGSNCVWWSIQYNDQIIPVIEMPVSPNWLREHSDLAGIPVLFPFPGPVRKARYNFNGQEYHLPTNHDSSIHHTNGLVFNSSWEVVEYGAEEDCAYLVTRIEPQNLEDG